MKELEMYKVTYQAGKGDVTIIQVTKKTNDSWELLKDPELVQQLEDKIFKNPNILTFKVFIKTKFILVYKITPCQTINIIITPFGINFVNRIFKKYVAIADYLKVINI